MVTGMIFCVLMGQGRVQALRTRRAAETSADAPCRNIHFPVYEKIANHENIPVGNRIVVGRRMVGRHGHGASDLSFPVQQPGSIRQMAFQSDDSAGYAVADRDAAPASRGQPGLGQQPAAGPAGSQGRGEAGGRKPKEEEKKEEEKPAKEGPFKLFHGPWLDCEHLDIRGYVEAG